MIAVVCCRCDEELTEPGALLFSPPREGGATVWKMHLCATCYSDVLTQIEVAAGDHEYAAGDSTEGQKP